MKLVAKIALGAAALGLPLAGYAASTQNDSDDAGAHANPPKPAITKAQAQAIALRVAPGQVAEAEYEREGGGWRWSFDIRQNGKIHEIGVDAMTGKIVENAWESAGDAD